MALPNNDFAANGFELKVTGDSFDCPFETIIHKVSTRQKLKNPAGHRARNRWTAFPAEAVVFKEKHATVIDNSLRTDEATEGQAFL